MKFKQNQFGDVSIAWREPMTPEEYSDLEQFVAIWMRGVKRRVEAAPVPSTPVE